MALCAYMVCSVVYGERLLSFGEFGVWDVLGREYYETSFQ